MTLRRAKLHPDVQRRLRAIRQRSRGLARPEADTRVIPCVTMAEMVRQAERAA